MSDYALPVEQPQFDAMGNPMPTNASPDYTGINPAIGKLFGVGGNERFQTWPERMVRSGLALPADVYSGREPIIDDSGHTVQPVIERAMDTAGLAGLSSIPLAEKGALGAIGGKFYSTLENTIAGSKVQKATPEQWTSYLKNQPGVKPEELEFSLQGLGDKVLTKEQLAQHVADNGIKFGEVWKGARRPLDEAGKLELAALEKRFTDRDMTLNIDDAGNLAELRMANKQQEIAGSPTKYSSYQLPGGENYRELLMTMPEKKGTRYTVETNSGGGLFKFETKEQAETFANAAKTHPDFGEVKINEIPTRAPEQNYSSSHWDEPNVLAHIRMNDREVPGVGKTLHVEEIQSDWHQAGRKQGYKTEAAKIPDGATVYRPDPENAPNAWALRSDRGRDLTERFWANNEAEALQLAAQKTDEVHKNGVPNAPFKKTWDELALKRVLSEAATKGYDAVSWTPGEAQAARYDLSKQLRDLEVSRNKDGTYDLKGRGVSTGGDRGAFSVGDRISENKLSDFVGKEMAEKIANEKSDYRKYEGLELKVGGEGMKAFYDTMLPAKANALIKKMGGKVEYSTDVVMPKLSNKIGEKPTETRVPIIKITPQMRENIANKGFPLYSSGVPTFSPVDNDPWNSKIKLVPVKENPFL